MDLFYHKIEKYGSLFASLIKPDKLNEIGAGRPDPAMVYKLSFISLNQYFDHTTIHDERAAKACLAGLYLHYDLLEEAHRISQSIETASGSFWHGIMHRREGDYWNSKYWFRQVGDHPVFVPLNNLARQIDRDQRLSDELWNPHNYIDLCKSTLGSGSDLEEFCKQVQQLEWQLLFDFCYDQAIEK